MESLAKVTKKNVALRALRVAYAREDRTHETRNARIYIAAEGGKIQIFEKFKNYYEKQLTNKTQ